MIWKILSVGTFLFAWFALGYSIGELRGYEQGKQEVEMVWEKVEVEK